MVGINALLPLMILVAAAGEEVVPREKSPELVPAAPFAAEEVAAPPEKAPELAKATVTAVPEGDVLKVTYDDTTQDVRLFGVDCPEVGQPFADKAKEFVTKAALNKEVQVQLLGTDSLGMGVAAVLLPDEKNLGHALVEVGLAWWDSRNVPKDRTLKALNAKALVEQKGLWADPAPLSPWDYRRSHDIPDFTYSTVPPSPTPPDSEEENTMVLSAKGDAVYTGGAYVVHGDGTQESATSRAADRMKGPPAGPLAPSPSGGSVINAAAIDFSTVSNLDPMQLLMRHQPSIARDASGAALGITASDLSQVPFATQLGFQDGDIISEVNGERIENEARIMELVNKFKNTKTLNVGVLRNGQKIGWTITLP